MVTLVKGKIKDMLRIETACLEGFQMEVGEGGGGDRPHHCYCRVRIKRPWAGNLRMQLKRGVGAFGM